MVFSPLLSFLDNFPTSTLDHPKDPIIIIILFCGHVKQTSYSVWPYMTQSLLNFHSTKANSVSKMPPVNPPTTISWLLGRTAAIQLYRGVPMWLMTSQESVVGLYM